MPNASTTQASSACETTGAPIPLSYGYVWATGKRHAYYTIQETGNRSLDYTRVGFWLLGHGEWDGLQELWINDQLSWMGDTTVNNVWEGWSWFNTLDYPNKQDLRFNWHSGCDAVIGSGLVPTSLGPDQGCDLLWSVFPPAVQPLCFSRIAYYGLMRKQPILYQTTGTQDDPSQWTDINPIGLWRALRCRLFDADGNVTGYAFTRNPVWHWVDVTLRRELFPDYALPQNVGPDPLPTAVSARFNWSKIYASAQYCDQPVSSGQARFSGDYSFAAQTSLQAIKTQMMLCCRGYEQDSQGQLALIVDRPRPSVFTFSREHILPGSFESDDQALHTSSNRYVGKFRDLLVPACSIIASIANTLQADPVVTTEDPHPFMQGDWIAIGGTGTIYDGTWEVSTVPAIIDPGTPSEVDPTTFTIARRGDNYPAAVGAGGACGLLYSRFKERSPEFWHKNNMLARGAWGLNIARQRNKVKLSLDFATSTYDQVSRVSRYERDRALGLDQSPYVTPARVKLKTSMFARDVNGALACGIESGDRVTLDSTASYTYQGDYEVVDPLVKAPPSCEVSSWGSGLGRAPAPDSGEVSLTLQAYNEGYMYDDSDNAQAGWPSVPGSYPGNDTAYSSVPLANGGNFVFFTGQLPTGSSFQLPSTGYPATNAMTWASPAGTNVAYHSATQIQVCGVNGALLLTLIYADADGHSWGGDLNYACLTWLSPDVTNTDANGMTWLPLTLLGGEEILFGVGSLADGATIALPAGWSGAQCFANAYIASTQNGGDSHILYLAGAWVDGALGVHCQCADHSGFTWPGTASVIVFAWKNNMGTVTAQTLTGVTWIEFPLTDGSKFGVGCGKEIVDSTALTLPTDAGGGATLEPMVGPSDSFYTSGGGHAQGIGTCYLDQANVLHITFNDGSGDVWTGHADLFACYTVASVAPATVAHASPATASIPQGSNVQFSALLGGNTAQTLTWAVDGINGGNISVGTIDETGLYTAPTASGTHAITATSSVTGTVASASVTVTGASSVQLQILPSSLTAVTGLATISVQSPGLGPLVALPAPSGATVYALPGGTVLVDPADSLYFLRGLKRQYGTFYTITGTPQQLNILIVGEAPQTGDVHELYGS